MCLFWEWGRRKPARAPKWELNPEPSDSDATVLRGIAWINQVCFVAGIYVSDHLLFISPLQLRGSALSRLPQLKFHH